MAPHSRRVGGNDGSPSGPRRTLSERRIALPDEVDLDCAPDLRDELSLLIAKDSSHLLVDCTQLKFIDSTGVAVLSKQTRSSKRRVDTCLSSTFTADRAKSSR